MSQANLTTFTINHNLMNMQSIHPQIDIKIELSKLDWVPSEYGSNNANKDILVKGEALNCLLESVH